MNSSITNLYFSCAFYIGNRKPHQFHRAGKSIVALTPKEGGPAAIGISFIDDIWGRTTAESSKGGGPISIILTSNGGGLGPADEAGIKALYKSSTKDSPAKLAKQPIKSPPIMAPMNTPIGPPQFPTIAPSSAPYFAATNPAPGKQLFELSLILDLLIHK